MRRVIFALVVGLVAGALVAAGDSGLPPRGESVQGDFAFRFSGQAVGPARGPPGRASWTA